MGAAFSFAALWILRVRNATSHDVQFVRKGHSLHVPTTTTDHRPPTTTITALSTIVVVPPHPVICSIVRGGLRATEAARRIPRGQPGKACVATTPPPPPFD